MQLVAKFTEGTTLREFEANTVADQARLRLYMRSRQIPRAEVFLRFEDNRPDIYVGYYIDAEEHRP